MLKIASIGMQTKGGAGLSSLKLHKQFIKEGNIARFGVAKETLYKDDVELIPTKLKNKPNWWNLGTVPTASNIENILSSGLSGKSNQFLDSLYYWSDVVLLRWITATVSDLQISKWSHKNKPLVWCLSDMAPFTGGCHYSNGCFGYEDLCRNCPMVDVRNSFIPEMILNRRKRLWKKITLVSPSKWLAECAKNSAIFWDKDIRVIRTGVELDVFKPYNQMESRKKFKIDTDKTTLLFGADSTCEKRKGYDLLIETLKILLGENESFKKLQILIIGNGEAEFEDLPIEIYKTGHIKDRKSLAMAYSAANVTILPYIEDNLPNVMLESIACGTPVTAFGVGGIPDVIIEGINGRNALPFDCRDLAYGIKQLINVPIDRKKTRIWAEKNLDIRDQALQYLALFNELIEKREDMKTSDIKNSDFGRV